MANDTTSINAPGPDTKVQIDKECFDAPATHMTGRELLDLAGKKPGENFAIYRKIKGDQPERIELDEKIDLSRSGMERCLTLPLDQTEGFGERRQFALPEGDLDWLESARHRFELVVEESVLRVVLYRFPVPLGYNHRAVDINVRIEPGYPDTQIDMVYVYPELQRLDGVSIGATCPETFDGKEWQRWSRHRTPANPWRPGIDNLAAHFALVTHWLSRELQKD